VNPANFMLAITSHNYYDARGSRTSFGGALRRARFDRRLCGRKSVITMLRGIYRTGFLVGLPVHRQPGRNVPNSNHREAPMKSSPAAELSSCTRTALPGLSNSRLCFRAPDLEQSRASDCRPARLRKRRWADGMRCGVILSLAVVGACDRSATDINQPPDIRQFVVGEAELAVGEGGFRPGTFAAPDGMLSEDRAIALAVAYVRVVGNQLSSYIKKVRGAGLDMTTLVPGSRAFYAETPYDLTSHQLSPGAKKFYGPWYYVPFYQNGVQVVALAVSAFNENVEITPNGLLAPRTLSGSDFFTLPIHKDARPELPILPETAVGLIANAARVRVAGVPRLYRPLANQGLKNPFWSIDIDRSTPVRTPVNSISTTEMLVGQGGALYVKKAKQLDKAPATYAALGANGEVIYNKVHLRLRPDVPNSVTPITVTVRGR
jgi:hypothetical protein